jgi:hypothetical protein
MPGAGRPTARRLSPPGRLATLVVLLIVMAWLVITVWYVAFGLLLVPYRLVRRGQRKRKIEGARHRVMLEAISKREVSG